MYWAFRVFFALSCRLSNVCLRRALASTRSLKQHHGETKCYRVAGLLRNYTAKTCLWCWRVRSRAPKINSRERDHDTAVFRVYRSHHTVQGPRYDYGSTWLGTVLTRTSSCSVRAYMEKNLLNKFVSGCVVVCTLQASSLATSSRRKQEDRKKALMKKRVAQRA